MAKKVMKTVGPFKKDNIITGHVELTSLDKGRRPVQTGSGKHRDKRKRRKRTRQAQLRAALSDQHKNKTSYSKSNWSCSS
jgi:hypothetical protein